VPEAVALDDREPGRPLLANALSRSSATIAASSALNSISDHRFDLPTKW
jgi:hypothetical protein